MIKYKEEYCWKFEFMNEKNRVLSKFDCESDSKLEIVESKRLSFCCVGNFAVENYESTVYTSFSF